MEQLQWSRDEYQDVLPDSQMLNFEISSESGVFKGVMLKGNQEIKFKRVNGGITVGVGA